MINGFLIHITNENTREVSVSLFNNRGIPNGVTIYARNSNYNFNSLLLMAINEGFMGSGISTDDDRIAEVTIYKNNNPGSHKFHKILDNKEIIIDGMSNYITLVVPPLSASLVQLIPSAK